MANADVFLCVVVVIGFEQTAYPVGESDGQVVLAVSVINGELSRPVVVTVTTIEESALGKLKNKWENSFEKGDWNFFYLYILR